MTKQETKPIRTLECNCCGEETRGRQWYNRDTGYGMCVNCIAYVRKQGMSEEEIKDCYGVEGIHWGVDTGCDVLREELGRALNGGK